MNCFRSCLFASIALFLLIPVSASATTLVYTTSDSTFLPGVKNQGWWSETIDATDTNENYLVGQFGSDYRNFFTFDVSNLSDALNPGETVISATLEITRFATWVGDPLAEVTYGLFDVSTDAATLNNNVGHNADIFDDLGSGTQYAAHRVDDLRNQENRDSIMSVTLNADAIADLLAARGDYFSVGGTLINSPRVHLFSQSHLGGVQRLVVETGAVPEPSTMVLFGSGMMAMLCRKKRTKAA